jgi:hypothetical protein
MELKDACSMLQKLKPLVGMMQQYQVLWACMQPCYTWWEVPYYWAGLKAYDLVANFSNLSMSRFLSAQESMRRFPTLSAKRSDGNSLWGTVCISPFLLKQCQDALPCNQHAPQRFKVLH